MENYEKKYKEVLEKAKALYKASEPMSGCNVIIETLFPELKESEDEKVIKEIIELVMQPTWKTEEEFHRRNVLCAWLENVPVTIDHEKREGFHLGYKAGLEKQGEKKPEMKTAEKSLGIDSDTYNKIVDECIFDEQNDSCVKDYNNIDPHFGKSIDKTEPKFHEGEWITNGDYIWKIVEVKPLDYILQSQDGNVVDDTISHVDEQFHSFTIADAKDGDVLLFEGYYNSIVLFQGIGINGAGHINYHCKCDLGNYSFNIQGDVSYLGTIEKNAECFHPATKEQRDQLERAMTNAGYKWNKEELKLEKI